MKRIGLVIILLTGIKLFGLAQPGGLSSNLELWLKADQGVLNGGSSATDGQAVNTWQDQSSARTNDATDATLSPPTFRDNSSNNINYNPVIDFDGNNDGLDFGGDFIYASGTGSEDGITFFFVVEPDASTSKPRQFIFDSGFFADNGYGMFYGSSHFGMYTPTNHSGTYEGNITHSNGLSTILGRFTVDLGTNQTFNINGANTATLTNTISTTALSSSQIRNTTNHIAADGPFTIGSQAKSGSINNDGGRRLDGSIAEIIGYNADLSTSDIARIESYLAIKYGITLDNTGGGISGDYNATDGTIYWDASLSDSYHNDVIGIGRDDDTGLYQKQSHSVDDSVKIFISNLENNNNNNSGSITNDISYLLIGHNNGRLQHEIEEGLAAPPGITARLGRQWKITNTNFQDDFNLEIEWDSANTFDINHIRLLVDTDEDFSDATILDESDGLTFSVGSIIVKGISTSHIPANSTRYITIASGNKLTPLPIKLLGFEAKVIDNNKVQLDWQTVSEINNDYFTIEHSINSFDWTPVAKIKSKRNSSDLISYSFVDNHPYRKVSYYRLKQNDFDGKFTYSKVKSVHIEATNNPQIEIYPNPSGNKITIIADEPELKQVNIYNIVGKNVTKNTKQIKVSNTITTLNLAELSNGVYYIKTKTTTNKIIKQ